MSHLVHKYPVVLLSAYTVYTYACIYVRIDLYLSIYVIGR